jgi:hypothetical protein
MDILQGVGLLALVAVAYFIYENYSKSQLINPEEERLFRIHSDAYRDLSDDFRSQRMDRGTFEKRKREVLSNPEEKRKVAQRAQRQHEGELERKEELNRMRIVGYKYEEFIFKIFNNSHERSWGELLAGIRETFNIPSLNASEREEYYIHELISEDERILNIWFDNMLLEECDWSDWSRKNLGSQNHFKVGPVLKDRFYKINDYDITYDDWLGSKNITLKHCEAYDYYMSRKA